MEEMSDHHVHDPGGTSVDPKEVELGGLPMLTNHRAEDDENPPITSTTHFVTLFQHFTLVYLYINLVILSITLTAAIILPNLIANTNIIQKQQFNPTYLKPNVDNGFLICFLNSIVNIIFIIFNKLNRLNPVCGGDIWYYCILVRPMRCVTLHKRLRLFSIVRCCQLGGGSVCDAESDKCSFSIGFVAMIGIHFLMQNLILTIINFINSISRLSMLSPVCGFGKWYQCIFFSARICICCKFRSLRPSLIIDTEFGFDFCLFCFNINCYFYFFSTIWYVLFCFFVNNFQCSLIESITWSWFEIWNITRGDR